MRKTNQDANTNRPRDSQMTDRDDSNRNRDEMMSKERHLANPPPKGEPGHGDPKNQKR